MHIEKEEQKIIYQMHFYENKINKYYFYNNSYKIENNIQNNINNLKVDNNSQCEKY